MKLILFDLQAFKIKGGFLAHKNIKWHSTSYNKRVSGFVAFRPNPPLSARTSDTRQPLGEMLKGDSIC